MESAKANAIKAYFSEGHYQRIIVALEKTADACARLG